MSEAKKRIAKWTNEKKKIMFNVRYFFLLWTFIIAEFMYCIQWVTLC